MRWSCVNYFRYLQFEVKKVSFYLVLLIFVLMLILYSITEVLRLSFNENLPKGKQQYGRSYGKVILITQYYIHTIDLRLYFGWEFPSSKPQYVLICSRTLNFGSDRFKFVWLQMHFLTNIIQHNVPNFGLCKTAQCIELYKYIKDKKIRNLCLE